MHLLKLVLPFGGLPMAGQALACKASLAMPGALAAAGPGLAKTGIHPGAPPGRIGGRSGQDWSAKPSTGLPSVIGNKHQYTHLH
jgi:hypothetical protein